MVKNSGADLEAVQEILGHANISTTKKYAKVAKSEINTAMEILPTSHKIVTMINAKLNKSLSFKRFQVVEGEECTCFSFRKAV